MDHGIKVHRVNIEEGKATILNSENAVYKDIKVHSFLFDLNNDVDESYDVKMLHHEKYKQLKDYLDNFNEAFNKNPRGWLL